MESKIKKVCSKCGNEDIWWDAMAEWCVDSQELVLRSVQDHTECEDCEGECNIKDVEIHSDEEIREMAMNQLRSVGLACKIENNEVYVCVDSFELELSKLEVNSQANEWMKDQEEEEEEEVYNG